MNRDSIKDCIRLCWEARHACQESLYRHCLPIGGAHLEEAHVRLMVDCMQICQAAADFMTRNSAHHAEVCAACAEICEACARSCEQIGDESMLRCEKACLACAESCREMSGVLLEAA